LLKVFIYNLSRKFVVVWFIAIPIYFFKFVIVEFITIYLAVAN